MHADYPLALSDRERVTWKVRLWDENDAPGEWSEPAFFEMGLLRASHWQAKWITGNYTVNKKRRYPADCFQKTFSLRGKAASARLYITACGLYSAAVNGTRVSMPLAPGVTDYRKRVQYQTYDVTALLKEHSIELDEHCFYVDTEYITYPIPFVETVVFIPDFVYRYRINRKGQSMSVKQMQRYAENYDRVLDSLLKFYASGTVKNSEEKKRQYIVNIIQPGQFLNMIWCSK